MVGGRNSKRELFGVIWAVLSAECAIAFALSGEDYAMKIIVGHFSGSWLVTQTNFSA